MICFRQTGKNSNGCDYLTVSAFELCGTVDGLADEAPQNPPDYSTTENGQRPLITEIQLSRHIDNNKVPATESVSREAIRLFSHESTQFTGMTVGCKDNFAPGPTVMKSTRFWELIVSEQRNCVWKPIAYAITRFSFVESRRSPCRDRTGFNA
jgi:hypothetical protein